MFPVSQTVAADIPRHRAVPSTPMHAFMSVVKDEIVLFLLSYQRRRNAMSHHYTSLHKTTHYTKAHRTTLHQTDLSISIFRRDALIHLRT